MTTYRLKLVTPERTVYEGEAQELLLRSSEGDMGVLAHHVPLITAVRPCVMAVLDANGSWRRFALGGGFLEVGRQETVILADTAETPQELDRSRAEAARARAADRLMQGTQDLDLSRARQALGRAEARLATLDAETGP